MINELHKGPTGSATAVLVRRGPGATLAGRYRLLVQVGGDESADAEFWRAKDTVSGHDVGLTVLCDTGRTDGGRRAADVLDRATRWGHFEHPGCARVLEVLRHDGTGYDQLPTDVYGLAVTEWVSGRSLAEAVSGTPLRTAAVLEMLAPLTEATVAAHRQGLVLGCAHPQRVRITPWGEARIAFALPGPSVTAESDVRGLGAILYALLTGLSGTNTNAARLTGLTPAPRDALGTPVSPDTLRPGVPAEVSELALGALGGATPGRVHTAAAVHTVISELLASESDAVLPPPDDGAPDEVWQPDTAAWVKTDRSRKRKLSLGMGALLLGMVVALGYLTVQLVFFFGLTPASPPRVVVHDTVSVTALPFKLPPVSAPAGRQIR
ncbi:protein kinase family protein [Pseudonocardia spinosispora]|uniref:protein kinase family protein n=1 Tax=Pseudonocardia spinosispora TaxID=103441 RepID=UPI00040CCB3F|nr:protein kinase family protein [Pseudonocardia spinosispora]